MTILYRLAMTLSLSALLLSYFAAYSNNPECTLSQVEPDAFTKNIDFGAISFDEEDSFDFLNQYLDTTATDHMSRAINPSQIMVFLNLLGIPQLLQTPLYLHTNIIHRRSLLDQPIFEPDRGEFPKKAVWGVSAFLNKTDRSNFTKHSTKLNSYLSITEKTLIDRLEYGVGQIVHLYPEFNVDIAKIFSLFENMTVEERQVGFMVHFMKQWKKTTFRIFAPVYYLENNFSLTKQEQDAVANEFGRQTPEEEKAFTKAHFACDKIGFGDTRIEIDQQVLKRPSLSMRAGLQATIPTAFTWGTGFVGSGFAKPSTLPVFNPQPLFEVIERPSVEAQENLQNALQDFFFDAFDRLAANLIDVKLGNNRHLGVGAYIRTKTPLKAYMDNSLAERIKLTNRISVEIFTPSTEKRFYINKINEEEFDKHNFQNLDQSAENLFFLQEQAVERLFLRAFSTKIQPGVIFRWTNAVHYSASTYGFNLGTDFWIQDKDTFKSIQVSEKTRAEIDVLKAKPPFGQQWKVFGGAVWKHKTALNTCFVSLNGDITMSNKGVGEDWEVSLNFEASF